MTRRNFFIILIAVVIVVFIIVAAAFAPTLKRKPKAGNNENEVNSFFNTNAPGLGSNSANANVNSADTENIIYTKEPSTQAVLLAIAVTFAEKYGSFSSDGNFENLLDAKHFMSDRMKDWTDDYIRKNKALKNGSFYGVTTRAIKPEILSMNSEETQAQVLVNTQQEEFSEEVSSRGRILYKRLVLDFIKVNNVWKVDAAVWQ